MKAFRTAFLVTMAACLPLMTGSSTSASVFISTSDLHGMMARQEIYLLHVARDMDHYTSGHIPGARLVRWSDVNVTRDGLPGRLPSAETLTETFRNGGVGQDGLIVLYGDIDGLAASWTYFALDYLGHGSRTRILDGGKEAWAAAGFELTDDALPADPSTFTPLVSPEKVAEIGVVRDVSWAVSELGSGGIALVDARPALQFTGAEAGDAVPRPGHIPGAVNLFWMDNIDSRENPVLKPEAQLIQRLYGAGILPRDLVITYCRTGGQASQMYAVLKHLGFNVRMYEGSYVEWSNKEDTPVERVPSAVN